MLTSGNTKWCNKSCLEVGHCITEWLKGEKFSLDDFGIILEGAGIKIPISLIGMENNKDDRFHCSSADGVKYSIRLLSSGNEDYAEIQITQDMETKNYACIKKSDAELMLKLDRRKLVDGQKRLNSYRYGFEYGQLCSISCWMDKTHLLSVAICDFKNEIDPEIKMKISSKLSLVEEYVFSLDTGLSVVDVYNEIVKLMELSDEELFKIKNLTVEFDEKLSDTEIKIEQARILSGMFQDFCTELAEKDFILYENLRKSLWLKHSVLKP